MPWSVNPARWTLCIFNRLRDEDSINSLESVISHAVLLLQYKRMLIYGCSTGRHYKIILFSRHRVNGQNTSVLLRSCNTNLDLVLLKMLNTFEHVDMIEERDVWRLFIIFRLQHIWICMTHFSRWNLCIDRSDRSRCLQWLKH